MSESTAALLQTVREGLQALAEELAAGKSERLCALLDFASRFHHYSLGNQALIRAACPQATYVAGYRTWQKLGYQVRKGERGIRILAPRPYTRTSDDGEEEQRLGFAAVAVFDASQLTETPALPSHRDALPDDQQERYAAAWPPCKRKVSASRSATTWARQMATAPAASSPCGVGWTAATAY